MFPTFDVPPQHAETVGARKARRAKEEDATRRSSSATSLSSGSVRSGTASSNKRQPTGTSEKSGFGWFGKKKGIQEISSLPSTRKTHPPEEEDIAIDAGPAPPTAPLPAPHQSLHDEGARIAPRSSHRIQSDGYGNRFPPAPPPLSSLPSLPPSGALPAPPSPSLLSATGMPFPRFNFAFCDLQQRGSLMAQFRLANALSALPKIGGGSCT